MNFFFHSKIYFRGKKQNLPFYPKKYSGSDLLLARTDPLFSRARRILDYRISPFYIILRNLSSFFEMKGENFCVVECIIFWQFSSFSQKIQLLKIITRPARFLLVVIFQARVSQNMTHLAKKKDFFLKNERRRNIWASPLISRKLLLHS